MLNKKIGGMRILLISILFCAQAVVLQAQIFNEQTYKFAKVLDWLETYYVDTVNLEDLVENTITDMLHELDPHSAYISKEEVQRLNEPLQGNFEGIGVSFNILYDTIYVVSPIPGGPSERVGIQAGDRIIEIEGKNVAGIGITNSDVFDMLRGKKDTKVNVTVQRRDTKKPLDFTIVRDKIPIYSLEASYMIDDNIGYIKINRFASTTIDEFTDALKGLEKQGMEKLILDLGDNGGGYLDVAVRLADQFLEDGRQIVHTRGTHSPRKEYEATDYGDFENGKLAIIIDQGSASASEIVAGAVQDWDRGIIIGRRSFGKGLVQRPLMLPDGSMIRLTTARYYTPTGRLIQKPYEDGYKEYESDILKRYNSGELVSKDSVDMPDSLKYKTLVMGRTVYGGGGIMPDVFVGLDTSEVSDYYSQLIRKGIIYRFVLDYIDDNRKKIESEYGTLDAYMDKFEISDKMINNLVQFADKEGLEPDKEQLNESKYYVDLLLKAYIARDIWDTSAYYKIVNVKNNSVQKAIEILSNDQQYTYHMIQQQ